MEVNDALEHLLGPDVTDDIMQFTYRQPSNPHTVILFIPTLDEYAYQEALTAISNVITDEANDALIRWMLQANREGEPEFKRRRLNDDDNDTCGGGC